MKARPATLRRLQSKKGCQRKALAALEFTLDISNRAYRAAADGA
ncbi:hypothetical protein P245_06625 [Comamonas thiooxydans]|uniref:Uncharacterized protein n=1 Tax=Comamonas thiooxydans TaxID=363952 RepID=A0A0E3C657_9BURK|nr:hypothetical protein P245_06625 [Comamonas thiooxydans]